MALGPLLRLEEVFPDPDRRRFLERRLPRPGDLLDVPDPIRGALRVARAPEGALIVYGRPTLAEEKALDRLAVLLGARVRPSRPEGGPSPIPSGSGRPDASSALVEERTGK
jgi:hypothetical protein